MGIVLATRERVQRALDIDHVAYRGPQIDQALEAATKLITVQLGWLHIHPVVATYTFDWPTEQGGRPWRLWLDDKPLLTLTGFTSGGTSVAVADLVQWPYNETPKRRIELDLASAATFQAGSTRQENIAATGTWGLGNDEATAGALSAAGIATTTATTFVGTDGTRLGIGSLIRVDSERMVITDRAFVDSTFNLAGDMDASDADTLLAVSGGSFFPGEQVIVDTEQMEVKAQTGSNAIVRRAVNGTVLAAHTGTLDIFVDRQFTILRGQAGTTAATHAGAAAVSVWLPPPLLESLGVAVAMDQVEQELGAYSRTVRSDDAQTDATGSGLPAAWERALQAHGRNTRQAAI